MVILRRGEVGSIPTIDMQIASVEKRDSFPLDGMSN
jgi:hypothetical protein